MARGSSADGVDDRVANKSISAFARQRLPANGTAAIAKLGYTGKQGHIRVVSEAGVSEYPWDVLFSIQRLDLDNRGAVMCSAG